MHDLRKRIRENLKFLYAQYPLLNTDDLAKPQTLQKILHHINQLAIYEGYEDIERICQDTTVVECNIKYPTNNGLVWDCIHESHRLLTHLKEEVDGFSFTDYTRQAKKNYFKINVTKSADKRYALFCKQLIQFTKVINQTSNVIKKNFESLKAGLIQIQMTSLIELMNQVYHMAYEREIEGNSVPNDKKLFSIYELHTDIIVKGQREVQFGHKISIANGTSNLILDCDILKGNPADKTIYPDVIRRIVGNYGIIPKDSAADGGYACKDNMNFAKEMQIKNIVFNKVVGSLKNQVSSKNIETRLKKWRSSGEAIISNLKRGYDLRRCTWKGWIHFQAKVLWSVIAYNIRVLTAHVISQIVAEQTPKVKLAA
jgi:transposase, IS5 family